MINTSKLETLHANKSLHEFSSIFIHFIVCCSLFWFRLVLSSDFFDYAFFGNHDFWPLSFSQPRTTLSSQCRFQVYLNFQSCAFFIEWDRRMNFCSWDDTKSSRTGFFPPSLPWNATKNPKGKFFRDWMINEKCFKKMSPGNWLFSLIGVAGMIFLYILSLPSCFSIFPSHTFSSSPKLFSTSSNLCFWRRIFWQISTETFCNSVDKFSRKWNCCYREYLC